MHSNYWESGIMFALAQVVAGVDHCHFLDIVLRDIKPENMLLLNSSQDSRRKLLKLCDFG